MVKGLKNNNKPIIFQGRENERDTNHTRKAGKQIHSVSTATGVSDRRAVKARMSNPSSQTERKSKIQC